MLNDNTKQEIRARFDAIAKAMPNFRSRPGQRVMIAEVAKAFARFPDPPVEGQAPPRTHEIGSTIVLINGGTGIGKSLGYSMPAIVLARQKGKKLVISSSTVALQEQLTTRDLPFFFKAANIEVTIEIAKGRTRYACNYRLLQAAEGMRQHTMFGRAERAGHVEPEDDSATPILELMVARLTDGSWNGDRDTWETVVDDTLWSAITTDRHGCLGRICPAYRSCAQVAARRRLREADVVVANHDLVLADLAMGGGKIIAKPEDCFYVFDEAHHLPEKAVSSFASSHMVGAGRWLAEKIEDMAKALGQTLAGADAGMSRNISGLAAMLGRDLGDAFHYLSSLSQLKPAEATPRPTLEFDLSCIPAEFHSMGENIKATSDDLLAQMKAAAETTAGMLGTEKAKAPLYEKLLADIGFYVGKLEKINSTWTLFLEEPAIDQPPIAKWIEAAKGKYGVDYKMSASPVLAAGYLRRLLWEQAAGALLTSANLTMMGSFDSFLNRSGLSAYSAVTCVDLPSPFDYREQGTLEIAKMTSSPKNYAAHTLEVTEHIGKHLDHAIEEGTLVLFTSRRQMEDVAARLPQHRGRILVQGQQSKAAIIDEHKARIDRGLASVIFGLESFSEGVDLAGKYCTCVVVPKLPFEVPDNPVLRTLSDWVARRGGNPFMEISVPDAARKLEQRVGRLIRTESDRGRVLVLDTRLWQTRYGRLILRGLPPFRLIAMGREVAP